MGIIILLLSKITQGVNINYDWQDLSIKIYSYTETLSPDSIYKMVEDLSSTIYYDESHTLSEYLTKHPYKRMRFENIIKYPKVPVKKLYSNGIVENKYLLKFTGNLMNILYPDTIKKVPLLTQYACPTCKRTWPEGQEVPSGVQLIPLYEEGISYTGIVIDARGIGLNPALFPKIIDEDGHEIYGVNIIEKRKVIESGVAIYTNQVSKLNRLKRIEVNPYRVVALRADGDNRTNIVIPKSEAQKLHSSSTNIKLLKEGKVVIIID